MSHVDDGQLNALLDGELTPAEARAVEAHVASCAECARRLTEARAFLAEAGELLGLLDPPGVQPAHAPASIVAPVAQGPAPAAPPVPGAPPAVAKTAKEVAISLDGRTELTPAIRPVFPHEVPAPKTRWKTPGLDKLAWAATIVLALGVGYLSNEVYRLGERGDAEVAIAQQELPRATDAAAPSVAANSSFSREGAADPAPARRQTAPPPPAPAARPRTGADAAAQPPKPNASKPPLAAARPEQLAARAGTASGGAGVPSGAAEERAEANRQPPAAPAPTGQLGEQQRQDRSRDFAALGPARTLSDSARAPAPAPAEADAISRRNQPAAAATSSRGATGAREASATTFRRVPMEEAVRVLSGSIRLIDGMNPVRVEVGPGHLVPGANPSRDVVRVIYADPRGGQLLLDQQLGEAGGVFNGLMSGDTLVAGNETGTAQVRWIDRKFWMSLSGAGPADSLRALVERIR